MILKSLCIGAACALGLAACGSTPYYDEPYRSSPTTATYDEVGRVIAIESVSSSREGRPTGAGAVVGGVIGGVLGHQIGSGRGNDAATVAGAIGGAVVGNEVEKRRASGDVDYRIDVRTERGRVLTVYQDVLGDLRVGDRVRVEGDRVYRM